VQLQISRKHQQLALLIELTQLETTVRSKRSIAGSDVRLPPTANFNRLTRRNYSVVVTTSRQGSGTNTNSRGISDPRLDVVEQLHVDLITLESQRKNETML
jgi:hypothetical protein